MPAKKKKNDNYFENLGKEFAQFMRARGNANEAEYSDYWQRNLSKESKTATEIKRAANLQTYLSQEKGKALKKERNAKGQIAGALLQGRRYKGNKQVKNSTKKK